MVYAIANAGAGGHNKVQNAPPGRNTDGHLIVDIQVTIELAMSPAITVHVILLLPLFCATPSFSIVSETLMMPQTFVT